ncbi:hypothetical protein BST61_g10987 [Cercospora zeina]
MRITSQSEWMKSQKHADIMSPDGHFEVVQTENECSLFFSLGTDHVFYVTREVQATTTGWTKTALSEGLSSHFNGAAVKAKAFAISQNAASGKYDLALIVTVGSADHLFISQGNSNADDADWADGVQWTWLPFDDGDRNQPRRDIKIADVYLMNVPVVGSTCVVDIEEAQANTTLDRYFVTPTKAHVWNKHLLPIDLTAGTIQSVLGRRDRDRAPGIYTYGQLEGKTQLIYAPIFNFFKPQTSPIPARLALPRGTSSIASAVNAGGYSNLFVSHAEGLSVFPHDLQTDDSQPVPCVLSPLVSGATRLSASTIGSLTSVWGCNSQGELVYMTCPSGSEASAGAWTPPVILVASIEQYACYTGRDTQSHTLYAHVSGNNMIELSQDPVTTDWRQRNITLPSPELEKVTEFDSYVTRLEIADDNDTLLPDVKVNLTSVSPVPVFINDVYHILSPGNAIRIASDVHGSINIVQPTTSMAAVCYSVALESSAGSKLTINPSDKVMQKINAVQSGGDLGQVQIEQPGGGGRPLVGDDVSPRDMDAVAAALKQFGEIYQKLNKDGTPTSSIQANGANDGRVLAISPTSGAGLTPASLPQYSTEKSLTVKVGDFFRMLKQKFTNFAMKIVDGVHHVFTTIGDSVYRAVLDCVSAVAHAAEWVLDKIKVAFDDLVSWLGFAFNWQDIVRTHNVLKNVIVQYVYKGLDEVDVIREKIIDSFNDLEIKINTWADITDPGETNGMFSKARSRLDPGSNTPQAQWAINHVKNHVKQADMTITEVAVSGIEQLLQDLKNLVGEEVQAFRDMFKQIEEHVIKPWSELTPVQAAKKLLAIAGDLLIKSGRNVIATVVDILRHVARTVVGMLDAPIRIPILSKLYKDISGNELSVLDLVCLALAVPATVLYKAIAGKAPFPDNPGTAALAEAQNWQGIQEVVGRYQPADIEPHVSVRLASLARSSTTELSTEKDTEVRIKDIQPTWSPLQVLRVIARFCNMAVTWLNCVVHPVQVALKATKEENLPIWLLVLPAVNTVVGQIQPIIDAIQRPAEWQVIYQDFVVTLVILKAIAGPFLGRFDIYKESEPYVDGLIQGALLPPHIGGLVAHHSKKSDYVQLGAQLSARIGALAHVVAMMRKVGAPEDVIAESANLAMNVVGGSLLCANAVMIIKGE